MWPIIMQFLRSRAPIITLPIASVIGVIGYNIEGWISDKYTPYQESIQDKRIERLSDDKCLENATEVKALTYNENVFSKNLSPSLK
ncbi:small integral membrane protein 12-A-like [Ctenocephalides felis]|uniref:small integral membrane protein 12-A-like n=1 Tax=Ctenocephalides felis TaxID=7515 RepID=UPI000E6E138B|nr:small integral membrane protein 12-A-like [Ctenocephalides felis]XP_026474784.1 small integral membrane protein 12-A-like [Ctenocephalides felis]